MALLALVNPARDTGFLIGLIALDVFMILTGLLAGSRSSEFSRGFFVLS